MSLARRAAPFEPLDTAPALETGGLKPVDRQTLNRAILYVYERSQGEGDIPMFAHEAEHLLRELRRLRSAEAVPAVAFDFRSHLARQHEWSETTFGPGPRTDGVLDHIAKELAEISLVPDDLTEWIDVVILALDGAWRAGYSPDEIIAALSGKQAKNEAREWPDWRTQDPNKAITHVKAIVPSVAATNAQLVSENEYLKDCLKRAEAERNNAIRLASEWSHKLSEVLNRAEKVESARDAALARVDELEMLYDYVQHRNNCAFVVSFPNRCNCGLVELIAKLPLPAALAHEAQRPEEGSG